MGVPPLTIPGDDFTYAGRPTPDVERSLTAEVSLDASHPIAVQAFSISMSHGAPDELLGDATVTTYPDRVGLTILADDGRTLTVTSYTGTRTRVVFVDKDYRQSLRPGRYLAVVELMDPTPADSFSVTLKVNAIARFQSSGRLTDPPSGFELSVEPIGRITTRTVTVLRASYRETIQVAAGDSERTLRLRLAGAALPVAAGGTGHVFMTLAPEGYTVSRPTARIIVAGSMDSPSASLDWIFDGPGINSPPTYFGLVGGDPTPACVRSNDACESDITIKFRPELMDLGYYDESASPSSTASTAPGASEQSTVTFVVEVWAYLLDAPSVPAGATVTLALESGPVFPTPEP